MLDWLQRVLTPQTLTSMVVVFAIANVMLGASAYLILLERRMCGWVQDRCGPNRVGPLGLFQPLADGLKLLVKEDFLPRGADRRLFILAPALTALTALIGFAVIPWGGTLDLASVPLLGTWLDSPGTVRIVGADVNIGIVYLVAVASIGVYGVVLGGWASNNKFSFLGGLRASAQMVSYEIPMGLALLCVILTAGTVRPDVMVAQQLDGQWFLLHQPVTAILFYACLLAEANRAPFDLAEAESELVGGWHTEYSSMKWALFFLGEYMHLIVGSAFFAVLFLGGWSVNPFTGWEPLAGAGFWIVMGQVSVMFLKVFLLICLTMVVRWTLPRFRFDQLMRLAWEGMIPLALLLLLVTSFFVFMGWTPYLWVGSLIALAIAWYVRPLLPRRDSNQRLGLIGSRFSPLSDDGGPGRSIPAAEAAVVETERGGPIG